MSAQGARLRRRAALVAAAIAFLVAGSTAADPSAFLTPEPVALLGYDGHAMEPFLSRDGRLLFFNTRNTPGDQTDIHWAERVDDRTFRHLGPLPGANSSALDGVPSLDRLGRFYFVSPRDYDATRNTLWTGAFTGERVVDVRPLDGDVRRGAALTLNIDAEISADGDRLYFTDNRWRWLIGGVATSNILVARRRADGAFERTEDAGEMFAAVNSALLEFAPALSSDELTLYFTRVDRSALERGVAEGFGIHVATRLDVDAPFGAPLRISAISGYVEAPTVGPNGCAILFHQRVDGRFRLMRAERSSCGD